MSAPVSTAALEEQLERFGAGPYLLTVGPDGRPHAVSVQVSFSAGVFATRVGRSSRANASARPDVTLLWPVVDQEGFSLIVDGTARIGPDPADDRLEVLPTGAVLHRSSARRAEDPPGSDCVTVLQT